MVGWSSSRTDGPPCQSRCSGGRESRSLRKASWCSMMGPSSSGESRPGSSRNPLRSNSYLFGQGANVSVSSAAAGPAPAAIAAAAAAAHFCSSLMATTGSPAPLYSGRSCRLVAEIPSAQSAMGVPRSQLQGCGRTVSRLHWHCASGFGSVTLSSDFREKEQHVAKTLNFRNFSPDSS